MGMGRRRPNVNAVDKVPGERRANWGDRGRHGRAGAHRTNQATRSELRVNVNVDKATGERRANWGDRGRHGRAGGVQDEPSNSE